MALGDILARLSVELSLNSAVFDTNAKRAGKQADALGDRMERLGNRVGTALRGFAAAGVAAAGAFAVNQVKKMATEGLEFAASLGEQAQQLGVTTSELQRYRFIATQVGISQDEMDKGLARLSITLGDVATGATGPTKALERLGLSAAEIAKISKLGAGEAIPFLADKFKALGSDTERASLAADLFGARLSGKFLTLLSNGSGEINKLADAYKKLGIEITEGQIAKADEAADKIAAVQQVVAARQAQIAASSADSILKFSENWENAKVKFFTASVAIGEGIGNVNAFLDRFSAQVRKIDTQLGIPAPKELLASFGQFLRESGDAFIANQRAYEEWAHGVRATVLAIPGAVRKMVDEIAAAITGRLNAVWNDAKAKVAQVKEVFFDLWDSVTRRSYVPDMVDDIQREMARLDSVLVAPAKKATEAAKRAFENMRDAVRPILDRLFPDQAESNAFRADSGAIAAAVKAGAISAATGDEAQRRLQRERMGVDPNETSGPTAVEEVGSLVKPIDDVQKSLERLGQQSKITTVQVAKTFKDMADATLASLSRLSGAIKGGGFLGILEAVIGLGLQLGSIGAFGKNIANRINTPTTPPIKGYASGTLSARRGLALVGERGAELVNFRGGERVFNNRQTRGMGSNIQIVPSPLFDVVVDGRVMRAAPGIMAGGAQVAQSRISYRQSRRVG